MPKEIQRLNDKEFNELLVELRGKGFDGVNPHLESHTTVKTDDLAALGRIVVEFSLLERELYKICIKLAASLDDNQRKKAEDSKSATFGRKLIIFCELMDAQFPAGVKVPVNSKLDKDTLLRLLFTAKEIRNRIFHDAWGVGKTSGQTTRFGGKDGYRNYTTKELEYEAGKMDAVKNILVDFI